MRFFENWTEIKINTMTKTNETFFQVETIVGSLNIFDNLEDAQEYIKDMKAGFPDREHMLDESREYWKEVGAKSKLFEVNKTEVRTEIK